MSLVTYTQEVLREYANMLSAAYQKKLTKGLLYNEFASKAMQICKDKPGENNVRVYKPNTHVKIAPPVKEMLRIMKEHQSEWDEIEAQTPEHLRDFKKKEWFKSIVKPAYEFDYTPPTIELELKNEKVQVPIWFNTTYHGINLRPGFANGDSASPARLTLDAEVVHAMGGGATGAGKSVMLNTIEASLLLEYPPWELILVLCDFKKVEASRFANRVQTPHVDIVAATGSTEYTMSVFQYLKDEMNARQSLYQQLGAQKNEDLINAIDMVVPQAILIVDEFTQLFENIKTSESLGNDHADEDKKAINSAISDIARLGRSMGVHMFLTSQQLDDLDGGVANQFKAGVSVFAPPSVSNSLIGNPAASTIRGKGKGYINKNKPAKQESDNELVRIPYINSEPDPDDPEKPTNLLEILSAVKAEADKIGYKKRLSYYNEDDTVPYRLFKEAILSARTEYDRIKNSSEITDRVKARTLSAIVPLGKPVRYNPVSDVPAFYEFTLAKNESLLIAGNSNKDDVVYVINLLLEGLGAYPDTVHDIIMCDEVLYASSKLSELSDAKVYKRPVLNKKLMDLVATRTKFVDLQSLFDDTNEGNVDVDAMFEEACKTDREMARELDYSISDLKRMFNLAYKKVLDDPDAYFGPKDLAEEFNFNMEEALEEAKATKMYNFYMAHVYDLVNDALNFEYNRDAIGHIEGSKFKRRFIWILGLDEFDFSDIELRNAFKRFIIDCSKVNVFCIITANLWAKCGSAVEAVENAIDIKASKEFFNDTGFKKEININPNTIKVGRKTDKSCSVISMYKI